MKLLCEIPNWKKDKGWNNVDGFIKAGISENQPIDFMPAIC